GAGAVVDQRWWIGRVEAAEGTATESDVVRAGTWSVPSADEVVARSLGVSDGRVFHRGGPRGGELVGEHRPGLRIEQRVGLLLCRDVGPVENDCHVVPLYAGCLVRWTGVPVRRTLGSVVRVATNAEDYRELDCYVPTTRC